MPRRLRAGTGGLVLHVLNRSVGRRSIFQSDRDYRQVTCTLGDAVVRESMRLLAYCIMPNHWHLILWPREDPDLSRFMHWFTGTHTQRWHLSHGTGGTGPIYQGRFRSFPIETDRYFFNACRYVERNALRAKLVDRAVSWRWSSLWQRYASRGLEPAVPLAKWPLDEPSNWLSMVEQPLTDLELEAVRESAHHGRPFGSTVWCESMPRRL